MKIAVAALILASTLAQAQLPPQDKEHWKPPVAKGSPISVTTSLDDATLGTVEIQSAGESMGVLPAVVRVQMKQPLVLVEYRNGLAQQTFRFELPFNGPFPQAIVALGDDTNGFDDILAGVVIASKTQYQVRFDKRLRVKNGKQGFQLALGPTKGFAAILFDSNPAGATLIIPQSGITATTPATLSLRYHRNETIHAFVKRQGSFDAPVTLKFVTDDNKVDWLITGDNRYAIPATPTTPITRIVALFEPVTP